MSIVTSGAPVEHPGELLARGLDLIASARKLADIVIIDTAPLLATDDASVILPIVDDLVLVCKAGRTPIDAAVRTRELLARLEASVVGVVIIGADQLPSSRSYYRTDYRSRTRARQGHQGAGRPQMLPPLRMVASNGANGSLDAGGGVGQAATGSLSTRSQLSSDG